ncbi:hypothetical protein BDQ17DRAFT_1335941 [Cyathus striatus]|nr:hypothetical protein BDQ17DRAFT_1335941 [Cyathus striatus]
MYLNPQHYLVSPISYKLLTPSSTISPYATAPMTNDPDKPSMRAPRRYKIKKEEDSDGEEYQQLTWDSKLNVMDISLLDVKNCMKELLLDLPYIKVYHFNDAMATSRKLNVNDWSSKLEEWKWNSNGQVMFNAKAHEIAKDIVTLTGLNPATATSEDMDYIDPIFSCNHVLCNFNLKKCYMRWKNAIYHALSLSHTYTAESGRHAFTLVTDVETRVYVEALLNMIKRCSQPKLVCVHCGEKGTYQEWINHSTKGEFMDDLDVDPCGLPLAQSPYFPHVN